MHKKIKMIIFIINICQPSPRIPPDISTFIFFFFLSLQEKITQTWKMNLQGGYFSF